MNVVSRIKVDMAPVQSIMNRLGVTARGDVQKFHTVNVRRRIQRYMPYRSGATIKQGVELEFQDYLDEAKQAADSAAGAVSAVTDMTVEAQTLDNGQPATVTKTTKNGKVNLMFGLPRGEQGVPGPAGATGPRGPQGAPGSGLTIQGHYDTEAELRAAVGAPEPGEAYGVGVEAPYNIYIFDGVSNDWKNYGPLSGGGGGILPEDVVTSEGGASVNLDGEFGDAPHVITITDEEEPPLTAANVEYRDGKTAQDAIDELFTSVGEGKQAVASAITDKGVPTAQDATFQQMAENIGQIAAGGDTSDATATPGDILATKTAYTASGKVEGIIPSLPAQTIMPGTADQTIASGQYLSGTQTVQGDPNLTSSNIRKGVSIFGVPGAVESSFASVLTVAADIGAVVTATCGDTSVEALSTTGTVALELPIEGTWKVTAVRGMAQYNTVTLEVTNQYSAALTAALHIEYFGRATSLTRTRNGAGAASAPDYAIFAGGGDNGDSAAATVDAYDKNLTLRNPEDLSMWRKNIGAAVVGGWSIFAGGDSDNEKYVLNNVDGYNSDLVFKSCDGLETARGRTAGATIGNHALFAGGGTDPKSLSVVQDVDSYDAELVRTTETPLAVPAIVISASNENYAIFCGSGKATAYNSSLTRTIAPDPANAVSTSSAAARAGNYVLFCDSGGCFAYDLFLTRVSAESMGKERNRFAGTTLNGFALFGGGYGNQLLDSYVDVYDPYLVRTTPKGAATHGLNAAAIGDYALFAGGAGYTDVDVYRYV